MSLLLRRQFLTVQAYTYTRGVSSNSHLKCPHRSPRVKSHAVRERSTPGLQTGGKYVPLRTEACARNVRGNLEPCSRARRLSRSGGSSAGVFSTAFAHKIPTQSQTFTLLIFHRFYIRGSFFGSCLICFGLIRVKIHQFTGERGAEIANGCSYRLLIEPAIAVLLRRESLRMQDSRVAHVDGRRRLW
jgi:hypothetical protein